MEKISKVDEVIEKLSDKIMELLAESKCKSEDEVVKLTFALAKLVESRANEKDIGSKKNVLLGPKEIDVDEFIHQIQEYRSKVFSENSY